MLFVVCCVLFVGLLGCLFDLGYVLFVVNCLCDVFVVVVCRLSFGVCCVVARCLLIGVRFVLLVVRWLLLVVRCSLLVVCCLLLSCSCLLFDV